MPICQLKNQNSYNKNAVKILKFAHKLLRAEGCSEPYQTSMMESFNRNSLKLAAVSSIVDILAGL